MKEIRDDRCMPHIISWKEMERRSCAVGGAIYKGPG